MEDIVSAVILLGIFLVCANKEWPVPGFISKQELLLLYLAETIA